MHYMSVCTTLKITPTIGNCHWYWTWLNRDLFRNFVASDKVSMPDQMGSAVGEEQFELLTRLAGNEVSRWILDSFPAFDTGVIYLHSVCTVSTDTYTDIIWWRVICHRWSTHLEQPTYLPDAIRDSSLSFLTFAKLLKSYLFVWLPRRLWYLTGT